MTNRPYRILGLKVSGPNSTYRNGKAHSSSPGIGWAVIEVTSPDLTVDQYMDLLPVRVELQYASEHEGITLVYSGSEVQFGKLFVFKSAAQATDWMKQQSAPSCGAIRGQFGVLLNTTGSTSSPNKLTAIARIMIDWYCMTGIHSDPFIHTCV